MDPTALSAADLAAAVRERRLRARDAAEACFARIDAHDAAVRAFLHLDREGALAAADAVDRR
ncbi:MAG: Asp-tRNA(Asn)/Glu-tRNA(Gln) amidotransferase GatCAB subunit A, partial [Planctomycetota bacterium]